jgi:hypothetical protein
MSSDDFFTYGWGRLEFDYDEIRDQFDLEDDWEGYRHFLQEVKDAANAARGKDEVTEEDYWENLLDQLGLTEAERSVEGFLGYLEDITALDSSYLDDLEEEARVSTFNLYEAGDWTIGKDPREGMFLGGD